MDQGDEILAPAHYMVGGIEPLDVLKAKLTSEQWEGFLMGSAIDYLLRANHKGQKAKDLQKAAFYARLLAGDDPRKAAKGETRVSIEPRIVTLPPLPPLDL